MTMVGQAAMKTIPAGSFKARCLAIMDEVKAKRETVVITKHGEPVAKLVPFEKPSRVELGELFRQMDEFRAKHPLNRKSLEKISYRDLIDGGRKR